MRIYATMPFKISVAVEREEGNLKGWGEIAGVWAVLLRLAWTLDGVDL